MQNNGFIYDDENHLYTLGGRALPNVTTCLQKAGLVDTTWFTDFGRLRGQAVHFAMQLIHEGSLDWTTVADEIRPYIDAALKFEQENKVRTIISEVPLYSPIFLFAGKPDRVISLNDEVGILDYKTGAAHASAGVQLAAYEKLVEQVPEVKIALHAVKQNQLRRWALELKNNGNYRLIPYNDRNDWNVFIATLTINNWIRVNGKGEI